MTADVMAKRVHQRAYLQELLAQQYQYQLERYQELAAVSEGCQSESWDNRICGWVRILPIEWAGSGKSPQDKSPSLSGTRLVH